MFKSEDLGRYSCLRTVRHHFPSKAELVTTLVTATGKRLKRASAIGSVRSPDRSISWGAYIGYWKACIGDASAPFCLCALLANALHPIRPRIGSSANVFSRRSLLQDTHQDLLDLDIVFDAVIALATVVFDLLDLLIESLQTIPPAGRAGARTPARSL